MPWDPSRVMTASERKMEDNSFQPTSKAEPELVQLCPATKAPMNAPKAVLYRIRLLVHHGQSCLLGLAAALLVSS